MPQQARPHFARNDKIPPQKKCSQGLNGKKLHTNQKQQIKNKQELNKVD